MADHDHIGRAALREAPGRVPGAPIEEIDLAAATVEIASRFRAAAIERALTLDVRCDPIRMKVDFAVWDGIVGSLVGEALARTVEGGIAVELRLEDGTVLLEVRDSSEGMPRAAISRLFEKKGMARGVAAAAERVRRIGGELDVRSELGRGTTCTANIPLAGSRPKRASGAQSGEWRHPRATPPRILVVDDNADMRSYVARLLEPRFEVEEAADGEEALAAAIERPPALVLTDVMMPKVDGFELIRALRENPRTRTVPVVVLSARGGEESLVTGLDAGADDYLVKPFSERELCARVETHLALNEARREVADHERALREIAESSRRQLHEIFTHAPALILVTRGREHVIELMNPAFARFLGGNGGDALVGMPLREAMPELAAQGCGDIVDEVYTRGEPLSMTEKEFTLTRGDASEKVYLDYVCQPLRDAQDEINGVLIHALDATERVVGRRQQEEYQARLALVTENVPALVAYLGRDLRYQFVNRQYEPWFGVPTSEVIGKTLPELIGPAAYAEVRPYVERTLAGETVTYEAVLPYAKGDRRIWATYVPDRDPSGAVRGFVALVNDVTERRLLEEKMEAAQRMESIGRLAGGVAHEVNNALTSVIGFADLLYAGLSPGDPRREDVELIHVSARRAAQIAQQLLAYSRRQILVPKLLDLGELVQEFAPMLRQAVGRNSVVEVHPPTAPATVMADRLQIEQVLLNLALNSRDAMERGGRLDVAVSVHDAPLTEDRGDEVAPGPFVELAVTDTGVGMDEEVKAKIFEPFFTTKPVGQGTGLGLAMVYGIVKQSGGHISVESEPGRGAAFRIRLPAVRRDEPESERAPGERQEMPAGGHRPIIVVLDDEPGVLSFLGRLLRSKDYVVHECATLEEARTRITLLDGGFDLLIADLVLPGGSGRDVAEWVRGRWPAIPVLFISGFSDDEMTRRGLLAPSDAFLQKPFAAEEILGRVRDRLALAGAAVDRG